MSALAFALVTALVAPQGGDEVFQKAVDGTVAADRRAISCLEAARQLCNTMNWNLVVESKPLEADLRFPSVDLNLAGQDPRIVANLIAVAGGADTVFDEGDAAVPVRPTLHLVRRPDASTESGRLRLRNLSAQWYRSFLVDELRHEPLVADETQKVRMHLGQLLMAGGDMAGAIQCFAAAYEDRPHEFVLGAVLRISECHLEIAAGAKEDEARQEGFQAAEQWARRVLDAYPNAPEVSRATVLLGRALIGQNRLDECRAELTSRVMRLLDTAEMLDVWLLIGEAQHRLGWGKQTYESMLTLRESPHFGDLDAPQFLHYHYLLGYGALSAGKPALAMKALEWFLIHAEGDVRRGPAHVLLAQAYLDQNMYLQARAAAVEARQGHMHEMDEDWRRRALKLYGRTALLLGDKTEAFQELETLVHRQDDPELTLFLVDELIADQQWQWAISVARLLAGRDDGNGDLARFKTVQAMFEQASSARNLTEFPSLAIPLALKIKHEKLRSQCAELIGQAYERNGKLEHAADAYRGILR